VVEDLAQAARRRAGVEAVEGLGRPLHPGHQLGEALGGVGAVIFHHVLEHASRVRVHLQGGLARVTDVGGHDLALYGLEPAVLQVEILHHVGRDREDHRARDLEVVAVEELDGGGHAADVAVLLDAQDVETLAREQVSGGEAVVPCPDDDDVVVRHPILPG
jgi:hypothetical protein